MTVFIVNERVYEAMEAVCALATTSTIHLIPDVVGDDGMESEQHHENCAGCKLDAAIAHLRAVRGETT